jgi:hypothetical protein
MARYGVQCLLLRRADSRNNARVVQDFTNYGTIRHLANNWNCYNGATIRNTEFGLLDLASPFTNTVGESGRTCVVRQRCW